MVDITATVEIAKFTTTGDSSRSGVRSEGSLTRVHEYKAELEVLLGPHPNLDAYNPAIEGEMMCVSQLIDHYCGGLDEGEEIQGVSEYKIHGSSDSWIETAEIFASERPSFSTYEALVEFQEWECTDARQVSRAIEKYITS